MRPASLALALLAGLAAACALILVLSRPDAAAQSRLESNRALVGKLGLTDLALFSEARYTRHPTQADLHSALQDHPGAFDHFPSGSLLPPPAILTESHAHLAGKATTPD